MLARALTAAVLLAGVAHAGDDLTFTEAVRVEDRDAGTVVSTTRATNNTGKVRSIAVTAGVTRFVEGELQLGKSATVTVRSLTVRGP